MPKSALMSIWVSQKVGIIQLIFSNRAGVLLRVGNIACALIQAAIPSSVVGMWGERDW